YAWNLTPQAFVPGLSRIRSGDTKGYIWPAVIGTFLAGAGYEDRHADKVAKRSQSDGLGSIFATPLVLGTYSLWTNGGFLLIAQDQYKNIRNQRAEYRRTIQNRNILLAGALATFGMAVIDGALMSDSQGFFYTTPGPGVGPIPGTRNLSNSTFTWKFTKDVWIPGKVRRNAGDTAGTVTLGIFGALGAVTLYESYHQYQLVRTSRRLKDSVANQAVTNPILGVALASYWTNPGFVYAVFDNNRQFTSLRNQYRRSTQVQVAAVGTAAFLYIFQVLDAASYSSSPGFFGPAPFEPGTNPPPMADMYCFGGPCVYSVTSNFRMRASAFIPGRTRIQNGDKKAGYMIAGTMIGFGAAAVFEDYEANKARRAAIRAGNSGVNALFSSQLAVAAGYQYWTSSSYLFLYQQYYHDVRKQSRAYSRAVNARTTMLGGAAILYGLQFLDATTLPASNASISTEKQIAFSEAATFTQANVASHLLGDLKQDLRREAVHGLVQDRIEFKDRFPYDVAEFHKTFAF
ncbi:MAG TPA: hypothetical protein PLB73_10240, partial [Leptospiraceae bacterium]|nr:hypothetical protein [Leptospiraceae bacterium]